MPQGVKDSQNANKNGHKGHQRSNLQWLYIKRYICLKEYYLCGKFMKKYTILGLCMFPVR